MATTFKGFLALPGGFINVAVKASPAARDEKPFQFNQLHSVCSQRIKMPKHCNWCARDVSNDEINSGYEIEKDKYVVLSKEEIAACKQDSSHTIEITSTVKAGEVDPVLFDASYYLEPDLKAGPSKAYGLLVQGLKASGTYAIGKITLNQREQVIIIRPLPNDVLMFHTMFYENEVRSAPSFKLDAIAAKELALVKELLAGSTEKFTHSEYADGYIKALGELIESKRNGTPAQAKPAKKPASQVVDLMEALQASIKNSNKRKKAA